MIIKSIELKNFRNYEELNLNLDGGTNILYGDNAQGKTNILESIYVSGTTKSHKGSRDKEMIRFGENEAHIRTMVEKNQMSYQIDMHLKKNRSKGIAINGVPIRKASELFGVEIMRTLSHAKAHKPNRLERFGDNFSKIPSNSGVISTKPRKIAHCANRYSHSGH